MATPVAASSLGLSSSSNVASSDCIRTNFYFTDTQLQNTPSRRNDISLETELYYRQTCALCIQELGLKLGTNQLTINTALVYMHRFYMFHSLAKYNLKNIAACAIFLASKSEEHPNKLSKVITAAYEYFSHGGSPLDPKSEKFLKLCQDLVDNEYVMLLTLGFDIEVLHPHTHVIKCLHGLKGLAALQLLVECKWSDDIIFFVLYRIGMQDLAQTAYFLASQSSHLSTLCLQYKPVVIAGVAIHIACKWLDMELPLLKDGGIWYKSLDPQLSLQLLDDLACKFLHTIDTCPSKLKRAVASNMDKAGLKQCDVVRRRFISGGGPDRIPPTIKNREKTQSSASVGSSKTVSSTDARSSGDRTRGNATASSAKNTTVPTTTKDGLSGGKSKVETSALDTGNGTLPVGATSTERLHNDQSEATTTAVALTIKNESVVKNSSVTSEQLPNSKNDGIIDNPSASIKGDVLRKSHSTPNFIKYGLTQGNSRRLMHGQKRKADSQVDDPQSPDASNNKKYANDSNHVIQHQSRDRNSYDTGTSNLSDIKEEGICLTDSPTNAISLTVTSDAKFEEVTYSNEPLRFDEITKPKVPRADQSLPTANNIDSQP